MSQLTTIVIDDPVLLAKLAAADGPVVLRSSSGDMVKTYTPVDDFKLPPGVKSPFTDEQIEESRKQPDGDPLDVVWKRITERHGS